MLWLLGISTSLAVWPTGKDSPSNKKDKMAHVIITAET